MVPRKRVAFGKDYGEYVLNILLLLRELSNGHCLLLGTISQE
jgi:hypothetical protein